MGYSRGSLGDRNPERNSASGDLAHVIAEVKKDSIRDWVNYPTHPWDTLVSNVTSFLLCPGNLSEIEFKDNGLNFQGGGISKQEIIQAGQIKHL